MKLPVRYQCAHSSMRLFKEMTVLENLLVAQHRHMNTNFLAGLLKTPASVVLKRSIGSCKILAGYYWSD